jgi:predicted thioesterase
MAKQVPVGAKGSAEERVQYEHTLTAHNHQLPQILTTAEMIRLMGAAAVHALQPFCEPGEISVSTGVEVKHSIAVGINAVVRASAEVEAVEGDVCRLRVTASEGGREIGSGTISRIIVKTEDYLKKYDIPKP